MPEHKQIMKTHTNGSKCWYNTEGFLHRQTGPAIIYPAGGQEWWLNGKLHRQDGPAIIGWNGDEFWYLHDKLHRLNGPAAITKQSGHAWYINGVDITQEVNTWMTENNITYPWDEQTQVEFVLRWG